MSTRLNAALKQAEKFGDGAVAEAINAVIVGLSDARHKARLGREAMRGDDMLLALLSEIEGL
jgi:hypothetical protein